MFDAESEVVLATKAGTDFLYADVLEFAIGVREEHNTPVMHLLQHYRVSTTLHPEETDGFIGPLPLVSTSPFPPFPSIQKLTRKGLVMFDQGNYPVLAIGMQKNAGGTTCVPVSSVGEKEDKLAGFSSIMNGYLKVAPQPTAAEQDECRFGMEGARGR